MHCVELQRDKGLFIKGPSRIMVEKGKIIVSGYSLEAGKDIIVRAARAITIYAAEPSRICIAVGSNGEYKVIDNASKFMGQWITIIKNLSEIGAKRILVVGEPDTGKSTFSLWVFNYLRLPLIEADIGQNELGYPTMVSVALPSQAPSPTLQDLRAEASWFVGHVRVDLVESIHAMAIIRAAGYCNGNYVVDTDGYVRGSGIYHKILLSSVLDVDTVVVMGENSSVVRIFKSENYEVYQAPSPKLVLFRTFRYRREYREYMYARIFSGSSRTVAISLDKVVNLCPISEVTLEALGGNKTVSLKAFICGKEVIIEGKQRYRSAKNVKKHWSKGLLAAIGVSSPNTDILSIVETIDAERRVIILRPSANLDPSKINYVRIGFVRLDDNYREVERLHPGIYPALLIEGNG